MHEVLTEHLPDAGPDEPDSRHVQISDLNQLLQAELSWIDIVVQLLV